MKSIIKATPGTYTGEHFPPNTAVVIESNGAILHQFEDGQQAPLECSHEWAKGFIRAGYWELSLKHKDVR